jgi:hypothetical protein
MARQKSSNEGSNGKLVDLWVYEYKGLVEEPPQGADEDDKPRHTVKDKKVEIELRIVKKFANSEEPPLATKEVCFRVLCKEADIAFDGTDIEALRLAVWEKLDKKFEIAWHRYLKIEIRPERPYDGIGSGFVLGWDDVDKGIAWDGTELLRERPRYGPARVLPWPGQFHNQHGVTIACIPATPQNVKALREFRDRIDLLRQRLEDYVRPENILKTLAGLANSNLLPLLPEETVNENEEEREIAKD